MKILKWLGLVVFVFGIFLFPLSISSLDSSPTYKFNNQSNPMIMDPIFDFDDFSKTTYEIGGSGSWSEPVTGGGMTFVAKWEASSHKNTLLAISLKTGNIVWQKSYPMQIQRIVYDDGKIYFGSDKIYSLDSMSGSEVWSRGVDGNGRQIIWSYVYRVENNTVFAWESELGSDWIFMALDKNNGSLLSSLGNYNMRYVFDIVFDQHNFYLINGSRGAHTLLRAYNKNTFSLVWTSKTCLGNHPHAMLDEEEGVIYIASSSEKMCAYSSETGEQYFFRNFTVNNSFVKYGERIYSFSGVFVGMLNEILPKMLDGEISYEKVLDGKRFASSPVVVNGVLYGGASDGSVWGRNLETNESKSFDIGSGWINYIAYADGRFVLRDKDDSNPKIHIVNMSKLDVSDQSEGTIEITSPYNTEGMNQYLGQLHAHWKPDLEWWNKIWNGGASPAFTEAKYRDAGYDFIALTEHNEITPDPGVNEIMHINSEEDTQGYLNKHILAIGIENPINENQELQPRIDDIFMQNGIPILAHPDSWVYPYFKSNLLNSEGDYFIEAYNRSVESFIPDAYAFDDVDYLGSLNKYHFFTAGDDYTPGDGGFDGAAVVVLSEDLSQESIMKNLRLGNFYATQGSDGPRIEDISITGDLFSITTTDISSFEFIGKGGKRLEKISDTSVATYQIVGDEKYVRVEIVDKSSGKKAWTQAVMVNKLEMKELSIEGTHITKLNQAFLLSNTSSTVTASTLGFNQNPDSSPPLGYLSPTYLFETDGDVNEGTELFISYKDRNILTNEDNLSIYTYDGVLSKWIKVPSFVDKIKKVVSAKLDHFSLYTLSADQPEDIEAPSVDLLSPTVFENLEGEINIELNATDNNAVFSTNFAVDDKFIATDSDPDDGWIAILNTNDFSNGDHKLQVSAEDVSGNVTEKEYDFSIINSIFVLPEIILDSPTNGENMIGIRTLSGTFSSIEDIDIISVSIDEFYIGEATIVDNNFSFEVDWDQIVDGEHQLQVVLADIKGNSVEVKTDVTVGELELPEITSPVSTSFLYSQNITIGYSPESENSVIKLDGNVVENNSSIRAYDLGLGEHLIELFHNDKLVEEKEISIDATIADMREVTELLYKEGHITKKQTYNSINCRLYIAQIFEKFGLNKPKNSILKGIVKYVTNQNKKPKPKIDEYGFGVLLNGINYLIQH